MLQCSCGPSWNGGVQLSSLSCGQPCAGNSAQRCGGWPGQSSVYRSDVGDNTTQAQGYLGCWQETTPKAVQGFGQWLDGQSVDSCRAICSAKNFALSGLSNGKRKSRLLSGVWLTSRMLVWKLTLFSLEPDPIPVLRKPLPWQYRPELRSVEQCRLVPIYE
jgi:hypothetical protein